jgi:formate dehydrogenase iron-sulfur subunit
MIKEAERRLKNRPERYQQTIYGKDEAGGTSILYLTQQPLDELGFKPVTKRSLPSYTWQALRLVPGIFLTVGGGLSLLSWFTHRAERIRREEAFKNSKVQLETTEEETKEDQP